MKKFIILLLAVAGFCRELNVSDLNGNEIKFELKDSALYENGKKIGKYNKTSAASIILAGSEGVEADFKAVRAKNLKKFKEYIFSDEGGIKVVKFSSKAPICEAFGKNEPINLNVLNSSYFNGRQISSYAFSVDIAGGELQNLVKKSHFAVNASGKSLEKLENLTEENIKKDTAMGLLVLEKAMCLAEK
ncbi:hypothetical protein [Campylobacter concisus]|uniref:Uncharacterized protein n=1 Tax=Campylobacter concisus TaxID=199 RepID=A0A7S9RH87_9BACT|nr:hypothetical protein [Campylobacter concisus]QPH91682.1 hypothetical protein CVT01_03870 [Campylobacter concisus]